MFRKHFWTNQKNLDAEYCIQCGEALFTRKIVEVKQCPDCKTNYEITDKFCDKDGKKCDKAAKKCDKEAKKKDCDKCPSKK